MPKFVLITPVLEDASTFAYRRNVESFLNILPINRLLSFVSDYDHVSQLSVSLNGRKIWFYCVLLEHRESFVVTVH